MINLKTSVDSKSLSVVTY